VSVTLVKGPLGRRRARLRQAACALALAGVLLGLSGCASARAGAPEEAAPQAEGGGGSNDRGLLSTEPRSTEPASPEPTSAPPDAQPVTTPSDPWTDRPEGPAGPPVASQQVRLRLPSSRPEPVTAEHRPTLPARARLALVSAHDAWLVRSARALLALGRELDDPRLAPVVALGPLATDRPAVDLVELALEADAQGFDLLLVDVRRGADDERDGLLVHAGTGALLAVFEVRRGGLPIATVSHGGDDLLERVGQAYARAQ
jgi:hypothetical protein